jgi:hypothetical protein
MATTTTTGPQPETQTGANGTKPRVRDLAISTPRRARVPELAVGLVAAAIFGLAGVTWHLSSVDKTAALAVAAPLERGDVIDSSDLRIEYVSSDGRLSLLDPGRAERVVGRIAAFDLPAGTLLSSAMVTDATALGADDGLVGLSLDAGQFPLNELAPGDLVNVYARGGTSAIAQGEVYSIGTADDGTRHLISLRLAEQAMGAVASADPTTLRLGLVTP